MQNNIGYFFRFVNPLFGKSAKNISPNSNSRINTLNNVILRIADKAKAV